MKPFPSIEFSKGQPKIEWGDFPLLRGKKLEKKGFGSSFSPCSADVFRDNSRTNRTAENGLLGVECRNRPDFLREADAQSGFNNSATRMQCAHKPMMRRMGIDLA
jgi:hypothetical protein